MDLPAWEPRRVVAMAAVLPDGVTPPGTRGRILQAGLELFAESGFAGASIRQIARMVGINSATLYAHYPSKGHVLAELVRIGHEEMRARLAEAADGTRNDSAARQLTALVRAHVLVHTDYPLLAVVTNSELHALDPELAAPSLQLRDECRRLLADVLERGIKNGEFSLADPLLAVTAIGGLGVQVAHWFGPALDRTREQVADQYAQFALRMVSPDR
ncbi:MULTISPECIES: TetR/AcrR family transcriptional regulator [unclassified Streptomyces]|uniref:TetR/AcrR family transcriptional regulator n=1 Tax=unclassified Streptomyces TaxID=2593676 RepID=UPI003D8B491F